jgi:hypothetical protein
LSVFFFFFFFFHTTTAALATGEGTIALARARAVREVRTRGGAER